MKKLLLSLSALIILGLPKLMAQLPNPGFETWTADALAPSAMDPNSGSPSSGWWDFNFANNALLGSSPITVFEGSTAPSPEQGSHYAIIVSKVMASAAYGTLQTYGFPYPDTNGVMITAYVNASLSSFSFKPGVPFNQKISTYSFWYRYIPNGVDTASCTVSLFHFSGGAQHLIGAGQWSTHTTTSSWTQANVTITYDSLHSVPDTILIQYSACSLYHAGMPKPGDTLDVDGATVLGIDNIAEQHDNVNLYPNPANTEINLAVTGQFKAANVEVYDITGRTIGTYSIRNNFLTINTQTYNNGSYFYKLLDDNGAQLNVGKFSVVK